MALVCKCLIILCNNRVQNYLIVSRIRSLLFLPLAMRGLYLQTDYCFLACTSCYPLPGLIMPDCFHPSLECVKYCISEPLFPGFLCLGLFCTLFWITLYMCFLLLFRLLCWYMTFACVWTMIVDYPLNKHCIWILSLCVLEQFITEDLDLGLGKIDPTVRVIRLRHGNRSLEDHTRDFLGIAYLTDFPYFALFDFFCYELHEQLQA